MFSEAGCAAPTTTPTTHAVHYNRTRAKRHFYETAKILGESAAYVPLVPVRSAKLSRAQMLVLCLTCRIMIQAGSEGSGVYMQSNSCFLSRSEMVSDILPGLEFA